MLGHWLSTLERPLRGALENKHPAPTRVTCEALRQSCRCMELRPDCLEAATDMRNSPPNPQLNTSPTTTLCMSWQNVYQEDGVHECPIAYSGQGVGWFCTWSFGV